MTQELSAVSDLGDARAAAHPLAVTFAGWMAGTALDGSKLLQAANVTPTADLRSQLAAVYRACPQKTGSRKTDLDALLRSDPTAVMDLYHPLIRGEPRRLFVLQRELQRTCLAATLGRLSAARRAAFILIAILKRSKEEAAAILDRTVSATDMLYQRAVRELDNYLGPRCEHIEPGNACHCSTRLGIAVERGFVGWPQRDDLPGDAPLVATRHLDAPALYATLPPPL